MKVLVACEESQTVCKAFRSRGHEAYSNDIIECSGGHPEWHLQMDALEAVKLMDWDLMIAHPPCTYIANSGARWLFEKPGRWDELDAACSFFKSLLDSPIPKKCVENPIPHKWGMERIGTKYHCRVQPWEFGDRQKKATCLWLTNLPPLMPTRIVGPPPKGDKTWEAVWRCPPGPDQKKIRSRTFPGIANAMAQQWG